MEPEKPNQKLPKTSTQDVLGNAQPKIDPRWQSQFQALTRLRDSIVARQRDLLSQAAEETTPPQHNVADLGTDEYDRDWALSMGANEQELLYEIDQALDRLRRGAYGICEATGKPIESERLKAVPWTRFSAEAEKKLEEEGQIRRARLGERQGIP